MELSRRGMLGGVGSALAIGAIGFVGAASVTDGTDGVDADGPGSDDVGGEGSDDDGEGDSVEVDPDAPFEARLLDVDGDADSRTLFDASHLSRVQGVISEDGEHLVYVALDDADIGAVQERLDEFGATDDPGRFVVSMALDGTEVRRVELDEDRVAALTDEEWGGVLTLPFGQEPVAADVYESLAAS